MNVQRSPYSFGSVIVAIASGSLGARLLWSWFSPLPPSPLPKGSQHIMAARVRVGERSIGDFVRRVVHPSGPEWRHSRTSDPSTLRAWMTPAALSLWLIFGPPALSPGIT